MIIKPNDLLKLPGFKGYSLRYCQKIYKEVAELCQIGIKKGFKTKLEKPITTIHLSKYLDFPEMEIRSIIFPKSEHK